MERVKKVTSKTKGSRRESKKSRSLKEPEKTIKRKKRKPTQWEKREKGYRYVTQEEYDLLMADAEAKRLDYSDWRDRQMSLINAAKAVLRDKLDGNSESDESLEESWRTKKQKKDIWIGDGILREYYEKKFPQERAATGLDTALSRAYLMARDYDDHSVVERQRDGSRSLRFDQVEGIAKIAEIALVPTEYEEIDFINVEEKDVLLLAKKLLLEITNIADGSWNVFDDGKEIDDRTSLIHKIFMHVHAYIETLGAMELDSLEEIKVQELRDLLEQIIEALQRIIDRLPEKGSPEAKMCVQFMRSTVMPMKLLLGKTEFELAIRGGEYAERGQKLARMLDRYDEGREDGLKPIEFSMLGRKKGRFRASTKGSEKAKYTDKRAAVLDMMEQKGGYIFTSDVEEMGISRTYWMDIVEELSLQKVGQGFYRNPEFERDKCYEIRAVYPRAILSHETALRLMRRKINVEEPIHVTVPKGYNATGLRKCGCIVHFVGEDRYGMGLSPVETMLDHMVIAYSFEKSVCDILRDTGEIDDAMYEDLTEACNQYDFMNDESLYYYGQLYGIEDIVDRVICGLKYYSK